MKEDFKAWFKYLLNMEIPEWIISPFDVEVESANLDPLFFFFFFFFFLKKNLLK